MPATTHDMSTSAAGSVSLSMKWGYASAQQVSLMKRHQRVRPLRARHLSLRSHLGEKGEGPGVTCEAPHGPSCNLYHSAVASR